TLIALDEGSKLSGLQRIVENDAAVEAAAETDPSVAPETDAGDTTGESV
ncbi:MAG: hypothetical protein RL260_1651, partial [Pseudomonadota bacterium]